MLWRRCFQAGLAILLGGTVTAQAQTLFNEPAATPGKTIIVISDSSDFSAMQYAPAPGTSVGAPMEQGTAMPAGTMEGNAGSDDALGPTPPEKVGILQGTDFGQTLKENGINVFGWLDMGYTTSSNGHGIIPVEPRENRFGNEFLLDQLALVIEKATDPNELSWGFRIEPYGGADAALLEPLGFIKVPENSRFGFDFRQLYVSAHLPILTEGGMDVKFGRMYTVIGYESAMAPYRPFYSNDYQWFYAEDGANTGVLTNLHITKQLDFINAITLGANTFFTERGESPSYIGQLNYWLQPEKKTLLSTTVMTGAAPIITAGTWATVLELRVQQNWNEYLYQIVQSDNGWEENVVGLGGTQFYSLYNIFIYHLATRWDLTNRVEWFDDVQGARTGFATGYEEFTFGADYHPCKAISFRPEIRYDYANKDRVWRGGQDHNEVTAAMDVLVKF